MKTSRLLHLAAIVAASTVSLNAQSITISNPSFESPTGSSPNGLFDSANGSIGSWEYTRTGLLPATLTDVTFGAWGEATDGGNAAQLTFLVGALAEVSIFQDLGTGFLSDSIYTLTFDAGSSSLVSLLNGASASIFANDVPVATLSGSSLLSLLDLSGELTGFSLQFETGAVAPTGNIGVGFTAGGGVEALGSGLVVDNVQLSVVPVPEPGTALLLGLSGVWLLTRRRSRS